MAAKQIHPQAPTLFSYSSMTTILFILTIVTTTSWLAAALTFNYNGFNDADVNLEGNASIRSNAVQITANEKYESMNSSVGWVTNSKPMQLWDKSSRRLTDFTTEFTFQIYAEDQNYGDGMTFFLADPNLPFNKTLTVGRGLGIAPSDPNITSKYQFVAVEFDTYQNAIDPADKGRKHVGIDINSIISKKTEALNMEISDRNKICYARIDYDSSTHNLSVNFSGSMTQGYVGYLWYQVDLRDFLPELVRVGFSASTGTDFEEHSLRSWSLNSTLEIDKAPTPTPTPPQPPPKKGSKIALWLGLGIGLCFLVCVVASVWLLRRKKAASPEEFVFDLTLDDEFEKGAGPKRFSYNELVSATNNFAEAEKLGQGGFGGVYRGFLKDLNSYVAIKRVSRGSRQGTKEYASEVKIISQLRHKNLVQLIGWCHQKSDLLLIYEFMPNRSLDFHLFEEHNLLTWQFRYNIAQGLASVMLYLQEEWEQCVLHRDIKSSNIMLDSNFNAKLGDFGLARLVDHGKGSQTTDVAGTKGYMAPEYLDTGKASKESDIFSFGVVALEIASGRKAIDLGAKEGHVRMVEWVWELYGVGKLLEAADPKLRGEFDVQQMEHLMVVGLWCAYPDYKLRPSIRQAIHILNFEAPLPVLPEKMPVPTYLPPPSTSSLSSFSLSTGTASFEIENSGNQSSKNSGHTSSLQFNSSTADSASTVLLHTH